MKLVCHIGTPKTASTFLQNTFAANAAWLERNGVIYPDLGSRDANHITLFYAAAERLHDFARDHGLKNREDVLRFREDLTNRIARQVAQAPDHIHTMLVSSENLTGNLTGRPGVGNLGEMLKPHFEEIRIVVYLRRQDDAILSMYGEFMRRGFNGATFGEFIESCFAPNSLTPYLYFRRLLNMWADVFGQEALCVRLFDRAHLTGGNILSDMMAQVFGKAVPDLSEVVRSPEDNSSLSAPVLEFLRRMYPFIPFRKNDGINLTRELLAAQINTLPSTPRPQMSAAQSKRIMDHFRPANDWLSETFFPHLGGPVFPDRSADETPGNLGHLSLDEFAEFAGHLLA